MQKMIPILVMVWISAVGLTGCASPKARVFGEDMPTMKAIHDKKFNRAENEALEKPQRVADEPLNAPEGEFQWLPNPTLTMYVFPHITPTGHPVPGYRTFFRMYTEDHIAEPSEQGGWE
ncbi:MAG: hypothetical protein JKX92_14335 [Porticoccaceae bacterium]|nr:hypothetical protein [Porticoccaceae bacterium]